MGLWAVTRVNEGTQLVRTSGVAGSFGFAPYTVVSGFPGAFEAADRAMHEQKRRRRACVKA
jgi:hypothetical protein